MNSIALIRPPAIKDSLGWFHPIDSVFRKKTSTSVSRKSEMTSRWIINAGGQYIDADVIVDPSTAPAPATWGTEDDGAAVNAAHNNSSSLSDDLARLKISANADADAHVDRLPPPNSKLTNSSPAAVASENNNNSTGSPLDSSSSNSSSSPHTPDHTLLHHHISHSRGASADTTHHARVLSQSYITTQHPLQSPPSGGNNSNTNSLLNHQHPLKTSTTSTTDSSKERPRSFSGGISTADLRRLSQGGTSASPITGADDQDRQPQSPWAQEQLSYPSLASQQQHQRPFHNFSYPVSNDINATTSIDDDQQYARGFTSVPVPQTLPHPHQHPSPRAQFMPVSSARPMPMNYRRTYTPQGPSPLGYGHHSTHHSLGNTQQLYEMMLPAGLSDNHHLPSPLSRGSLGASAASNGIQQSPVFRATHHHSASDPSALRDPSLALLNNNIQTFAPGMFQPGMHTIHAPPPPLYPGQFYNQELAMQQLLTARIQAAQAYTGPYGVTPAALASATASTPQSGIDIVNNGLASPGSSNGAANGVNGGGPSANNRKLGLYKTELCRSWEEKGTCRYGAKCQFAHGEEELRNVARHPKYKTEICKTFWVSGSCPYGKRCCFIHTELSSGTNAAGSPEHAPQPSSSASSVNGNAAGNGNMQARERSNSDSDTSTSVSLLTRISQRSQNNQENPSPTSSNATPLTTTAPSSFSLSLPLTSRPPTGSLRVDTTNVEPNLALKQNKSAYPTFASNGILLGGAGAGAGGVGNLEFGGNGVNGGVGPGGLGEGGRGLGTGMALNGAVGRFRHEAVPVTAGPDFGRHNLARMEIVGYPTHQRKGSASSITNVHHSLSGSDIDLSFSPSPPGSSGHAYSLSTSSDTATSTATSTTNNNSALSPVQPIPTRLNGHGHARTGSAGTLNWGSSFTGAASGGGSSSASRNSSHHPLSTSVGSTWGGELTARAEKTWV